MKRNSLGATALLALSLLLLSGCDQAQKSAQQLMGKAAESARHVIDDTHKAAEQALNDATRGLITPKATAEEQDRPSASTSQET